MIADIGHAADIRQRSLRLKAVVLAVGRDLIQQGQVGREQQRSVVQHPPLAHPLRTAGYLLRADGNVARAVFLRRDADGIQRLDNGLHAVLIIHHAVRAGDVGIVHIAEVVIDRAAAAAAAHDGDLQLAQRRHMYLAADVLVASHHDAGRILPEQKDVLILNMLKNILLKRQVIKRVVGAVIYSDHNTAPVL